MFTAHALPTLDVHPSAAEHHGAVGLVRGPGATLLVDVAVEPTEQGAMDEARRIAREAATMLEAGAAAKEWTAFVEAQERAICAQHLERAINAQHLERAINAQHLDGDGDRARTMLDRARAALLAALAPRSR